MKKLITILLIASALTLNAQDGIQKNRIKANVSYSSYQSNILLGKARDFERMGNYQINIIYTLPKLVEFGVYGGYSWNTSDYYNLGINTNIQILPFILPKPTKRLELYVVGKVGQLFEVGFGNYYKYWEYSGGLGASIYPFSKKRIGLFAEYTMGKYFHEENDNFKFGLSFRLF